MKKNLLYRLSLLVMVAVFAASCSKQADYVNAIPADATSVVSMDLPGLTKKAGADDASNQALIQQLKESMKGELDDATFEQMESIMDDPAQSGIDLQSPVYFFTSPTFVKGIVAKVTDENKLQALLQTAEKQGISTPVSEADGYRFATTANGQMILAFNSSVFFVGGCTDSGQMQAAAATALRQTAENSINSDQGFLKMLAGKGDIRFYASMNALPKEYAELTQKNLPEGIDPNELKVVGALLFEEGRMTLHMENYTEDPEIATIYEKQSTLLNPIQNSYLKHYPQNTLFLGSIGMEGENLMDMLQTYPALLEKLSEQDLEYLKTALSPLTGETTFGLTGLGIRFQPNFLLCAGIKNKQLLDSLYASQPTLTKGKDIVRVNEDEYIYKSREITIYYGAKGDMLYATNDEQTAKGLDKALPDNASGAAYTSGLKGKQVGLVLNAEAVCALPIVQAAGMMSREYQTYLELGKKVAYLEVTAKGLNSTLILQLKDKDTNALKQLVDAAKTVVGI